MNPFVIAQAIAATLTDEYRKFMLTYVTATQGSDAAKRWR